MIIAVGSGKGGTGKTTLSTAIAEALVREGRAVQLLDCDVEEPNAHLLLAPAIDRREPVRVLVPAIDRGRCTFCGACADACRFHALVVFPEKVLTFPEMCHSCTACMRVCPVDAIGRGEREIGTIEIGRAGAIRFGQGLLAIGESRATPVIAQLLARRDPTCTAILDAPPGTSCPFVETARAADAVLLVADATPFGHNDLALAVEALRLLEKPFAVIVNRAGIGDDRVQQYCRDEKIPILLEIEHDLTIARAAAEGRGLLEYKPQLTAPLLHAVDRLAEIAGGAR